jgi:hypothetical protein
LLRREDPAVPGGPAVRLASIIDLSPFKEFAASFYGDFLLTSVILFQVSLQSVR